MLTEPLRHTHLRQKEKSVKIENSATPASRRGKAKHESHRAMGYGGNKGIGKGTGIGRPSACGIVTYLIEFIASGGFHTVQVSKE